MIVLLPAALVVLLVFSFASGSTELMVLMPMVLVVAAGGAFVAFVLREGQARQDSSVRRLPTDHLRRQMYLALRPPRRAKRQQEDPDEGSE